MDHAGRRIARFLAVAALAACAWGADRAVAQCRGLWAQAHLGSQTGHVMVYDSARGRTFLQAVSRTEGTAGGTWAWGASGWKRVAFDGPSPARTAFGMAYDSARDRAVVFGGLGADSSLLGDTWEFDGWRWRLMATDGPAPRHSAGLAYNSARGTVMLFGGATPEASSETWEWDGLRWTRLVVPGPPGSESALPMVYDSFRQRLILIDSGTWEFTGLEWRLLTPQQPPWQSAQAIAYDSARHRVVVFGGEAGCTAFDPGETWEYDELSWVKRAPPSSPAARSLEAMTYDASLHAVVMYGGKTFGFSSCGPALDFSDTWTWDGTVWSRRIDPRPELRVNTATAFHAARGRTLLFGGQIKICGTTGCISFVNDTWEWDASGWTAVAAGTSPSERAQHAMAYDSLRGRVVLYGGAALITRFGDTWAFNGGWTPIAGPGPGPRSEHALAYDPGRDRVVLFGGVADGGVPTTTWELAGASWLNVTPDGTSPGARSGSAMAFDPRRGTMLLFGGGSLTTGAALGDTWEWNGQAWAQLPVSGPPGRLGHTMSTDTQRAVIVMTGGGGSTGARDDTWEWNGQSWSAVGAGGPVNIGPTMAYDSARSAMYMRSKDAGWEWIPPALPIIMQQSVSKAGTAGRRVTLECVPAGPGPRAIEWLKDGVVLQDGGRIRGATTTRLIIEPAIMDDAGSYDVRVSNGCGRVDGQTIILTMYCAADCNQDGFVDGIDYDRFNNDFEAGNPAADFNGDGFVDGIDYDQFNNHFEAGC